MKRFLLMILAFSMLLTSCSNKTLNKTAEKFSEPVLTEPVTENKKEENIKGVWISFFELPDAQKGENSYKKEIDEIFDNIKTKGYNTAFVHVRAFCDSIYPSKIFPWAKYCCKNKNPNFDPLKIIINSAHSRKISVHAWINPFRISSTDDINSIPKSSPVIKMLESKSTDVIVLPNGIYFNPASPTVHALIYKGVREILENYDVEGVHIDDYFYPTQDEKIDEKEFKAYKKSNGNLNLCQWRKNSVSAFVTGLYEITKEYNKVFSISPSGNIKYNEEKMYADIKLWMSEKGYADLIIPQIYYGFEHEKFPFMKISQEWASLKKNDSVSLLCGIAQYKLNLKDENAGETGKNEWIKNPNIIEKQINFINICRVYSGFVIFSYSYINQQKIL